MKGGKNIKLKQKKEKIGMLRKGRHPSRSTDLGRLNGGVDGEKLNKKDRTNHNSSRARRFNDFVLQKTT